MIVAFLTGAVFAAYGGFVARRRKGQTADILQYAAVYGIIGMLLGFLAAILLTRLG